MPPRNGQLDEISEAIGELKGSVKAIETYVHEGRHGVNNLSQKFDALGVKIAADIAAVEARIEAKVDAYIRSNDERVLALEKEHERQTGAKNLVAWFLQSPLIGWIVAAVLFVIAYFKGLRP